MKFSLDLIDLNFFLLSYLAAELRWNQRYFKMDVDFGLKFSNL